MFGWRIPSPDEAMLISGAKGRGDGAAPFKIVKEERTENDVSFTIEAGNWDWYMGWFLSFGSRVTIIEPEAFRARLFEVAQATANHHGAGASTV